LKNATANNEHAGSLLGTFMYLWLLGKTFILMMFTLPIGHRYLFFNLTNENLSYHLDSSLYK